MKRIVSVVAVLIFMCAAAALPEKSPLGNDPAKFDAQVEAATLRNDVAFFQAVLSPDVRFSHGTGAVWDKEPAPLRAVSAAPRAIPARSRLEPFEKELAPEPFGSALPRSRFLSGSGNDGQSFRVGSRNLRSGPQTGPL